MSAPMPIQEGQRLAALQACAVLDTAPEPAFDDIARLASQLCEAPIALVSLVDASRQWFKARVGVEVAETPREIAFCAHAIMNETPLIVPDASKDPRFADNPFVKHDPHVRFYAGIPLVLEPGVCVGTLCVIDVVPRELTNTQLDGLMVLANQIARELNLRRRLAALGRESSRPPPMDERKGTGPRERSPQGISTITLAEDALPVELGAVVDDRYHTDRVLGVGGMGVVVEATDLSTDRRVAIKFIRSDMLTHADAVERFVREARALLLIQSEHVARVLDVGNVPNGAPFIVMEFLEGQDLEARLRAKGKLSPREAVRIVFEAASAVAVAHAHGILHRDLKPANLFLAHNADGTESVKVLDFGISKLWSVNAASAQTALTSTRAMLGSPMYMAPQQMTKGVLDDARSDVWSLGVVLYEALSSALPYGGTSVAEVCANVLTLSPIPIEARRADLPLSVRRVIARCLEREPNKRFATAADLRDALGAVLVELDAAQVRAE